MIINNLPTTRLLAHWMDYQFKTSALANVSVEHFNAIKAEMLDIFVEADVTDNDVKAAWKEWFDIAANDGTLISSDFSTYDAGHHHYGSIAVIDVLLKEAYTAIDAL